MSSTSANQTCASPDADALLRALNMHAIVSVADRSGRITEVNDAFCQISGFKRDELLGQNHRIINSGVQPHGFWSAMWQTISSGTPWRGEVCNRARNGSLYWVDTFIAPFAGADGKIDKYVSIRVDITSSKTAELRIAQDRERLDNILNGTDAGTWEWNLQSGDFQVNGRYAQITGMTPAELANANFDTWVALAHPQDLADAAALLKRHLRGELPAHESELRLRHAAGHWVWVLNRGKVSSRAPDGTALAMSGTIIDISARKLAEQKLRESQAFNLSILNSVSQEIAVIDRDGVIIAVNAAWDRYSRDNSLAPGRIAPRTGVGANYLDVCREASQSGAPDAGGRVLDGIQAVLEGRLPRYTVEYACHCPTRQQWFSLSVTPLGPDGHGAVIAHTDVTERIQTQAELADKQQKLNGHSEREAQNLQILDAMSEAVLIKGPDSRIIWANKAFRLFCALSNEQLQGLVASPLARADTTRQYVLDDAQVFATGRPLDIPEDRAVRFDGVVQTWHTVKYPLFDRARKVVATVGVSRDITSQIRVRDALRAKDAELQRNNALLSSILDNLPCGLCVFNAQLELVAWNADYPRLLDLPRSLLESQPVTMQDLLEFNAARGEYGSDPVLARQEIQRILARSVNPMAHRFERQRPDGTVLEVRGARMPDGGLIGTYVDVTAHRKAEDEARSSTQLLRGAIDAINDAFVLYDANDRLVLFNERYRELYAKSADLMVPGATFEDIIRQGALRGQYADAVGRVDEWVTERMALHRQPSSKLVQQLDDGRWLRIVECRMPDGQTVGFRVDITELVHATEAAQKAQAAAEAANQAKSQFLANMSHEIRTPMHAVLGMLALLHRTELTARQADYAGKAQAAAQALLGLLNEILDFSKVEAGRLALDPQPFETGPFLRDLSVILAANLGRKEVELLFDVDPAMPPRLVGDAMRLQQVLINLGGNAIKFTAQGEVVLSMSVVSRQDGRVTLEIAVRDTGIGIAAQDQEVIFSAFMQAEASTTRRFGGTGLGLAISQRLVALMGGDIRVDSREGQGSRFHFRITLPEAAAAAQADAGIALPARFHALVVDDNQASRDALRRMCLSLGWTVDAAASGEQALQMLLPPSAPPQGYQAIFMDWQMPGLDGWETSLRMRELALGATAAVILMVTAHGRETLAQRSEAEHALLDGFLVKPVTAFMLRDAVLQARRERLHPTHARSDAVPGGDRLAGLRLLVAEDNLINQQVALELFESEGASVQMAGDGRQAVQAIAAAPVPFDLVLMDLQMPVMDGLAATRYIRGELKLPHLPVVAMTANAMPVDRDACLDAGMDDHVGKPFDIDHVVRVIHRLTRRHTPAGLPPPQALPMQHATLPAGVCDAAKAAGVDAATALDRLGGKLDLYGRLLGTLAQDLSAAPARLRSHLDRGEFALASRMLHSLKGSAATLGMTALSRQVGSGEKQLAIAASHDQAAKATHLACNAIEDAGRGLATLLAALLDAAPPALPATAAAPMDGHAFHSALRALGAKLRNSDMAAADALCALRRQLGGSQAGRLDPLDEAVHALDFERALALCDGLLAAPAATAPETAPAGH